MSHWPFILASYAVTLIGTAGLTLWSWAEMRRVEADAESLRQ